MTNEQMTHSFIESARNWVCDGYSASIRFIAGISNEEYSIWDSSILLSPIPPSVDNSFHIQGNSIYVGQFELISASQQQLVRYIENAQNGFIETPNGVLRLHTAESYSYCTEAAQRDLWFYQLHLQIVGRNESQTTTYNELSEIDNFLRLSKPPFDGINDVASWLGLKSLDDFNRNTAINVRVSPPIDLIFEECILRNNSFKVVLHAHPEFNVGLISLAVRGGSGNLEDRIQIASEIVWGDIQNNRRIGTATISIKNCENVLAMLLIGNTVVRRQWFLDPDKARNNRLIAVQGFDKNLKMIKTSVLETTDSNKFEYGVAALLFLLGFSPCVQLETDSPDIIVQTPRGRIILIECTLRISDFSSKLGKLVDRRGALKKELENSGHSSQIAVALVCRLPRDQIAADQNELINQNALLITQETLLDAFNQLRVYHDPDKILEDAEAAITSKKQMASNI